MSRIGRLPVAIPAGVEVSLNNNVITVKGKLGTLTQEYDAHINIKVENNEVILTRDSDEKEIKAKHGLYRALIANMIKGVTEGYSKKLVLNGVGYKVAKQGNDIVLNVGFSHEITVKAVEGIKFECPSALEVVVSGISKEKVGEVAASIRAIKKVEPYHGYGIKYDDEIVIRKQGKTAGKK